MQTIEIALASDEGYVCGLIVTAASMAMNASRDVALRFHILDCGISEASYEEIVRRVAKWHPHVSFVRHRITDEMLKDLPAWHGGKGCYARLFLPSLLPDVHFIVYCDVDFLWVGDVAELWLLRNDDFALWSVHDAGEDTLNAEEAWHRGHGLSFDREKYFCSGLCFMNLAKFREKSYAQKALDFVAQYPDVRFPDQAALNYVLRGDVKLVDAKWQQLTALLDDEACKNPCVFHYAGDTPWKRPYLVNMMTDALLLWHSYYARIYGLTVWQSLRRFFSAWQIVYRRLLWYAMGHPVTSWMVCGFLRAVGKGVCISYLRRAYRPLEWRIG